MQNWAAIFDWDGVILDSCRQHEMAWQELARIEGRTTPENFFRQSFGMKNEKVIPELLLWSQDPDEIHRIALRKEAVFRDILRAEGAVAIPGVVAWLDALKAASIPCAVGSSGPRLNIECAMEMLGLQSYFQAGVYGDDVMLGKPNPAIFLLAAQRLGFPPSRCVVFEDAHVGIEAALAAGMKCIAVPTTHPPESLQDAHRVVNRLDELSVAEVGAWFE